MIETIKDIAEEIRVTKKPRQITVRELIAAIGYERRGKYVTSELNTKLNYYGLDCNPGFENTYFDALVTLSRRPGLCLAEYSLEEDESDTETEGSENATGATDEDIENSCPTAPVADEHISIAPGQQEPCQPTPVTKVSADEIEAREVVMTVKIGILAAGVIPALIRPNEPIFRALTQMNDENLGELVVTNGERGSVQGIFSWLSFGKAQLAGKHCETVGDCMNRDFAEIWEDKPFFEAVREVIRNGVVVVKARDNRVCGLVTLRDVADAIAGLSEPFFFLGQIENHLRELVERLRLTADQLQSLFAARNVGRVAQDVKVDDFTLGELIGAIQNPGYWAKLGLNYHHTSLLKRLERVRNIRNKVMHFNADRIDPSDKDYLTATRRILQGL